MQELIDYVADFKNIPSGKKPCNEQVFIDMFIKFLDPDLCFEFDGDGAYFGKQITISRSPYMGYDALTFEIAYSNNTIRIYDGNNNGYWVPEYVNMTHTDERFDNLKNILFNFIKQQIGIL